MSSKLSFRFSVVDQIRDNTSNQLVLKLKPLVNRSEELVDLCECVLSGFWFGCDLQANQVIHVLDAKYDHQMNRLVVDNDNGFVIASPDVLISSTTLMSAKYCMRKSWLSTKFCGWTQSNRSMIIGVIVHHLFQESCRLGVRRTDEIKELFLSNVNTFISDLYSVGITKSEAIEEISFYFDSIAQWMDRYVYNMSAIEDKETNHLSGKQSEPKIQVLKVLDIEDSVWSTKLGLKGVIDLTVKVAVSEDNIQTRLTMPLELKTGKASFSDEHIGQIGLYSVLLDERDSTHNNDGLLLYLKDKPQMRQIVTKRAVKRDLIQMRNNLVKHWSNIESGPEPLNSYRICSKCEHLLDCCLTLKTLESQHLPLSPVMSEQLIPQVISHLSDLELEFFNKWMTLLNIEMKEVIDRDMDSKVGFWTQSSMDRESKGLGFGKLRLVSQANGSAVFVRSEKFSEEYKEFNLSDNVMRRWERVAISLDNNSEELQVRHKTRVALLMGFIKRVDKREIEIILDKKGNPLSDRALYRLDHLSSTGMMSSNYTNLLRLMDLNDNSQRLRQIVIHKQTVSYLSRLKRQIVTKGKHILKALNHKQQKAILSALSTDSYVLVRGMPGAGKTQTIIALIRLLVALDQSVLVTSYTHAAVDNILLKLKLQNIDFLRIGSQRRVDRALHSYTDCAKTSSFTSVEELEEYYSSVKVVASTCLGVSSHPLFQRRTFDYCIVDEASQVLLPTCLGPLFHCKRFLLVGDDRQLPPVLQSHTSRLLGLDQSLFVLLQSHTNTTDLTIQYRMNSEIMRISNELTYNGVLKCSSLDVCNQTLIASHSSTLSPNNWLSEVMATDLSKSVVFIETDSIPAPEVRDIKGKVFNETEGKLIEVVVKSFLHCFEITDQQIAVISPYQRQVRFLRDLIGVQLSGLEINTVDQFQGRDKEIVIYSCVKSNGNESIASNDILNDSRRLNVALTRAKKKLVLLGSKSTLIHFKPFEKLFQVLRCDQILSLKSSDLQLF